MIDGGIGNWGGIMRKYIICLAAAMSVPASVRAQQQAIVLGAPQATVLRSGTEVPMKTRTALTTEGKTLRVGARVELEVAQDVILGGQTVIPAGTPAVGELTQIRNKGMWGKSGYIEGRVLSIRVGDRQIRMSGVFNDKGVTGTAGVVAAIAFIPIAGFVTTGTSARIPLGAPVKGFLDEDVPVQLASASSAPAPLIVAAPAKAVTPTTVASDAASPAPTLQPAVIHQN